VTDPVDRLARLAGLELDPSERERLVRHLAALQTLIDALPEELAEVGNPNAVELVPRPDEPGKPLSLEIVAGLNQFRHGPWVDLPPVHEGDT
jgi:Asp-tRNA(Asn)/Glu-tRNA(Gln) amidotransferase C subunit